MNEFLDGVTNFLKLQEALRKQAEMPILKYLQEVNKEVQGMQESFATAAKVHKQFFEELQQLALAPGSLISMLLKEQEKLLRGLRFTEAYCESILKRHEELSKEEKKALVQLGEIGWFFDPEMSPSFLHELDGILAKDKDGLVEYLKDFFRKRVDTIERKLTDSYPCRGQLLCDAIEAHRHGKYSLSIPVFFAQADGIFWERFLKSLFISEERKCAVSDYDSQIQNEYYAIYLHPLSLFLPLWKPESKMVEYTCELNRHQVLHGKSVDYGTELNSLKAVALLNYLHWILGFVDEAETDA